MAPLRSIGVLGAGTIGSGLAEIIAKEGLEVVLVDIKPEFIESAVETISGNLERADETGFGSYRARQDSAKVLGKIRTTTDPSDLKRVDFVIDTIVDDFESKRAALKNVDDICGKSAVFTVGSHGTPMGSFHKLVSTPERLVGLRLFAPVPAARYAEVVRTPATSDDVYYRTMDMARLIGLTPVTVPDSPGGIARRILGACLLESVRMATEGDANIPTIDAAAKAAFGLDEGFFEMMNRSGIEVAAKLTAGLDALGNLYAVPERLRVQLGNKERWILDGPVDEQRSRQVEKLFQGLLILVGLSIVDDGVGRPEDIEIAVRCGLRFKNGPFELVDRFGLKGAADLAGVVADRRDVPRPGAAIERRNIGLRWVESRVKDKIATITVNRPMNGNGFDGALFDQIAGAFEKHERDDRVAIIVFEGGCKILGGIDRNHMADLISAGKTAEILAMYKKGQNALRKIAASEKITVARLEGPTLAEGAELALACRHVIAGPQAVVSFPETGRGILPACGGTQRLPRRVGKSIGKYLLLTGEVLFADKAQRFGVVDVLCESADGIDRVLLDMASGEALPHEDTAPTEEEGAAITLFDVRNCRDTLAGKPDEKNPAAKNVSAALAEKAPVAIKLTEKLIDDGLSLEMNKALGWEIAALELILETKDARRGLTAEPDEKVAFTGE